jgi:hypothetical protein
VARVEAVGKIAIERESFTTEEPARHRRNQISEYLPQRSQREIIFPNFALLAPWRDEYPSPNFLFPRNLHEPRELPWRLIDAFSQTRLGKRGSPVGEQPQSKLGLSLAKTQRPQRSERKVENHWGEYLIFSLRIWRLCVLARGISESENLRRPEYLVGTL